MDTLSKYWSTIHSEDEQFQKPNWVETPTNYTISSSRPTGVAIQSTHEQLWFNNVRESRVKYFKFCMVQQQHSLSVVGNYPNRAIYFRVVDQKCQRWRAGCHVMAEMMMSPFLVDLRRQGGVWRTENFAFSLRRSDYIKSSGTICTKGAVNSMMSVKSNDNLTPEGLSSRNFNFVQKFTHINQAHVP